jgi:hypothetical protein
VLNKLTTTAKVDSKIFQRRTTDPTSSGGVREVVEGGTREDGGVGTLREELSRAVTMKRWQP